MSLDLALIGFKGESTAASMFGSRYVDVEETDHVSVPGAGDGALTGALLGVIFGPPGFAAGMVLGGIVGAETGKPTDLEPEPELLINELRDAVPSGHSAIALLAEPAHVDAMLSALGESDQAAVVRRPLTVEQASALIASIASIAADPPA